MSAPPVSPEPASPAPLSVLQPHAGPTRLPLPRNAAFALAFLSGILYWLAFPGKLQLSGWHGLLSLVAFAPLWIALLGQPTKRALWLGVMAGATMNVAGFTWLLDMLETFSGFPAPVCFFFVLVVCVYQGGRIGLLGWLFGRATKRGWPAATVFVSAFAVSELVYPLLFPWYFAATAYKLPALSQTAELGGPILAGSILVGVNIALAEPLVARLSGLRVKRLRIVVPLGVFALALAFAAYRIPSIDRRAQASPAVHVGVVQGNLGLIEKREDPAEGLRRHLKLTDDLKARGAEFVVWSESSVTMTFPEGTYAPLMRDLFTQTIGLPAIIGTVLYSEGGLQQLLYNTALSVDARGNVTGRYDKEFLLAFGEYLPLGDAIPKLYEWSPNSGHFTRGTLTDPLPITLGGITHPVSAFICYEDILPSFTNRVVAHAAPELLVSMSNDAWFGDTSEPWEHLALAQLSAVEHRRYLVRSTNSGVSAIVDPVGRVMVHGGTFDAEAIDAVVHWMHAPTLYELLGDAPWYALAGALFVAAFRRRPRAWGRPLTALPAAATFAALGLLAVGCGRSSVKASADTGALPGDAAQEASGFDAGPFDAGHDEEAPTPPVDAGPCPAIAEIDFGSPSCNSCTTLRCCPAATGCYALEDGGGEPACALLVGCLGNCEGTDAGSADAEASCLAGCRSQYGAGTAIANTLESCIEQDCENEGGTGPCNF